MFSRASEGRAARFVPQHGRERSLLLDGVPALSTDLLNALTLLTFGSQLRGSYNTVLGQEATKSVFQMIRLVVLDAIQDESASHILVRNAAGRLVRIEFAPDPDIAIREQLGPGRFNNRIAIEIKGGQISPTCTTASGKPRRATRTRGFTGSRSSGRSST